MTYADAHARIVADGPWGFWPQTETGGLTLADESGNARHMAITGTPTLSTDGPQDAPGTAWKDADYARPGAGLVSSPFTLTCWVYLDPDYVAGLSTIDLEGAPVICHEDIGGSGSHDKNLTIVKDGADAVFVWYVHNGSPRRVHCTVPVAGPTWVHVTASIGAAGHKLRANKVAGEINPAVVSSYTGKTLRPQINKGDASQTGETRPLLGIALPAVWTRQLTDAETDAQYDALLLPPAPAPDADRRWWTHRLAASLGLDPVAVQPVVEVRTHDGTSWSPDADLSNALAGYTVTYGRSDATSLVDPLKATLTLATARIPTTPAIATRLQVALCQPVADALGLTPDQAIRFTGEVTDPTVTHDTGYTQLVCVGRLGRGYRMPVDGTTWPVEDDGDRVARILAATGIALDVGTIDAGTRSLAPPTRLETSAKLVEAVTASATGQLVEQPSGDLDWHDAEHRRGAPVDVTLASADVLRAVSWSQRIADLVNIFDVTLADGTTVTVVDPESSDPNRYGAYPASTDTRIVNPIDAYALGIDVVGRRADPAWHLPNLTVDLIRTVDLDDLPAVLKLRHASLIALTDLPAGCPIPGEVFVEGWTETATARTWRLAVPVSDPVQSGTGLRWIDWPDDDAYQWQDLDPDLTWLDLARITDPADTI